MRRGLLQRLDTHHGLNGMGDSLSQGFNEFEGLARVSVGFSEALVTPQPRCGLKPHPPQGDHDPILFWTAPILLRHRPAHQQKRMKAEG